MAGDSGVEGEKETARIVVANGMDFDKRYFYEVTTRMSRDWDLRKLSLLGPPIWVVASVVAAVLSVRILLPNVGIPRFDALPLGWVEQIVQSGSGTLYLVGLVVLATAALAWVLRPVGGLSLRLAVHWLVSVWKAVKRVIQYLLNLVNVLTYDVWQNLNYWHPFTTHLSGRDPLVIMQDVEDATVSGIYSDEPHYNNIFVDSIYLEPKGELTWKQQAAAFVYGGGRSRRNLVNWGLLLVVISAIGVVTFDVNLAVLGVDPIVRQVAILVGGIASFVLLLASISEFTSFNARFRADSAGLSRYRRLLNEPESESPLSRGRRSLSNSMCGYGLLYLSRFISEVLPAECYDVQFHPWSLMETDEEGGACRTGRPTPKRPRGYGPLNDSHATAAASELLWSSVPPASVRARGANPEITLSLKGVDYLAFRDLPDSWFVRRRLVRKLIGYSSDSYWGSTSEFVTKQTAGERSGIRLPIKKFMSVRDDLPVETIENPSNPSELLFFAGGDDGHWDEDVIHCLFLGGGEHQQSINKLMLALKSEGFDNVDVLENAFSTDTSVHTLRLRRRVRSGLSSARDIWNALFGDGEDGGDDEVEKSDEELIEDLQALADEAGRKPTRREATDDGNLEDASEYEDRFGCWEAALDAADVESTKALFPTEYFVSFVGADESFRQEDHGFILFRHELKTDDEQTRWAHVVIGMSAVATKAGALYWHYLYHNDFEDPQNEQFDEFEEDVLYFISTPGPIDFADVEDIGDLYLDTSWQDRGGLTFRVEEDDEYQWVESCTPDDPEATKKLGMEYYELDITNAPTGP